MPHYTKSIIKTHKKGNERNDWEILLISFTLGAPILLSLKYYYKDCKYKMKLSLFTLYSAFRQ